MSASHRSSPPPSSPPLIRQSNKRRRTSSASASASSASNGISDTLKGDRAKQSPRYRSTLYDAVAGRVGTHGFRNRALSYLPVRKRDTLSRSFLPITPTEALLRRRTVADPDRDEESYHKHRLLTETTSGGDAPSALKGLKLGRLPESDMLKAIHAYCSDFYAASTRDMGRCDWKSLDETALLAMGILIEEEVSRLLGKGGFAIFVDQQEYQPTEKLTSSNEEGEAGDPGLEASPSVLRQHRPGSAWSSEDSNNT